MIRKLALPGTIRRVRFVLLAFAFSGVHARAQSPPPVGNSLLLAGTEPERQRRDLAEPLEETSRNRSRRRQARNRSPSGITAASLIWVVCWISTILRIICSGIAAQHHG